VIPKNGHLNMLSPFKLDLLLALMFLCWDYLFKLGVFIPLPILCYLPTLSLILCCHSSTFSTYLFQVQFACFKFCEVLQVPIATLTPSISLLCEMSTLSMFHCWYIPPNPFYIGFGIQNLPTFEVFHLLINCYFFPFLFSVFLCFFLVFMFA
jgi:hypothetical protein